MLSLHHQDEVCPGQVFFRDAALRGGGDAGGADFNARVIAVDSFGGGTAPLIAAADEKKTGFALAVQIRVWFARVSFLVWPRNWRMPAQ